MVERHRNPETVAGPFEREEFATLPMKLAARLASGAATLAELRALEPGTVLNLETQVGEPSILIANGEPVGQGEIVEIKGKLAFRVTRLGKGR